MAHARARRTGAPEFYEWLAPIYDDLYDAIDVEEAVRQWRILLRRVARLPRVHHIHPRLLDLGCGTGRYLVEWATSGFDVTGVDASRAMVARARQRAKTVGPEVRVPTVVHGDVRQDIPLLGPRGPFDAAVAHFNFLNLFTEGEISLVLSHLGGVLAPGAFLFADSAHPGLVSENHQEALTLPSGECLTISTHSRGHGCVVRRNYDRGGSTRSETYRLHSRTVLRRAARAAGWRLEHAVDWCPERRRSPWSFTSAAANRHRVYAFRYTGTMPSSRSI